MNNISVPVIMYHSIGVPNKNWQWSYLTCPYNMFENQLKWIKKKGFNAISLQQLYDYMKNDIDIPKKSIILTFDDGYLDNWVFAYPLLKKYDLKGTIYINPEFVDSQSIIRKNLEDVRNGSVKINDLKIEGYLSWKEIEKMENECIMDTQSHTMTHSWYPLNSNIIDFRHPGDSYIWMTWNDNTQEKPYLQLDDEKKVNFGEPVYESNRAIKAKQYFPDANLKMFLINYVKEKGGEDYFQFENWMDELLKITKKYKNENKIDDRFETEKEYEKRVNYELYKSKKTIENKLNKEVNFLCWPGGAVTNKALNIASEIGYNSSTVGKDLKDKRKFLRNRYGEDPLRINRIGTTLFWDGIEGFNSKVRYKNGLYFLLSIYQFQGKRIMAPLSRMILSGVFIFNKFL